MFNPNVRTSICVYVSMCDSVSGFVVLITGIPAKVTARLDRPSVAGGRSSVRPSVQVYRVLRVWKML